MLVTFLLACDRCSFDRCISHCREWMV